MSTAVRANCALVPYRRRRLTNVNEVAANRAGTEGSARRLPLALMVGGAVALAALVFPLVGARWAANEARHVVSDEVYEGQQTAVAGVLERVDDAYEGAVNDVTAAASTPDLVQSVASGDQARTRAVLADIQSSGGYGSVVIDRTRASAAAAEVPRIENGKAVMAVRAAIEGGQGSLGDLVATVPFSTLTGGDAALHIGSDVNVTLLSKDGVILATPTPGLEGTRPIAPETLELIRRGMPASKSYYAPRLQRDVLVSFVPDAKHPWSGAASSLKGAELAAANRLADRIVEGGAVMAVIGVLLAVALGVVVGIAERRLRATRAALADSNRELALANADLSAYANVAAHDLRTPLVTIRGRAEMIPLLEPEVSERTRATTEVIVAQADRMFELIDAMLKYSRAGAIQLVPTPVDLNDVVRRVLASVEGLVRAREATVTVSSLPTVDGDDALLAQLLQNLLENAVRYGDADHPEVHVTGSLTGDEATILVQDNGPGVPVTEREAIFEMFARGSAGATVKGGSGIGLALARRIAERHGGTLAVVDGATPGATFELRLPLHR